MSGSNKPYNITFKDEGEILHAVVEGEHDSYEISIGFWQEVAHEAELRGSKKVLVEESIEEVVTLTQMYGIAAAIPNMFRGVTLAFVDRYGDQDELNSFGELVAQNRGVRGRMFADVQTARDWLITQ